MVDTKLDATFDAMIGLGALTGKALSTNHFANGKAINIVTVVLWLGLGHGGEAARKGGTSVKSPSSVVDFGRSIDRVST